MAAVYQPVIFLKPPFGRKRPDKQQFERVPVLAKSKQR